MSQYEILMINRAAILSERFGNEVVAINNNNGNYYSLNGISADIWALLESGASLQTIIEQVENRYASENDQIASSVTEFVDELLKQELVVVAEAAASPEGARLPVPQQPLPFDTPRLEVYSDMQDLLLLDPIHEVDETGWPNRPRQE